METRFDPVNGREIAHIIYVDELPKVTRHPERDDDEARAYAILEPRSRRVVWSDETVSFEALAVLAVQRAERKAAEGDAQ